MKAAETRISELLNASQRPFKSRLEVVCYLWLTEESIGRIVPGGAQERYQAQAKELAAFLEDHIYLDADRRAK